uniref:F-box domain-containing protein n=1 Tax=Caenorhabditis japonica TaxID=281687 RepID=A0A8R1HGV7_CAEJA
MISQDALQTITEHLSPTSRLNLAAIDQRFFDVATRWSDVKTIVFDDEDVTLAGANFVYTYQNSAFDCKDASKNLNLHQNQTLYKTTSKETALKLCPAVKKLIIQTKLSDFDAIMLDKLNMKLTKLYIGVDNLSLVNFPKFEKLRSLHLVLNSTKEIKIVNYVDKRVLEACFPPTLTRVCLTGIFLTENLLLHLSKLPNLVCLDLIGCLVDTLVSVKYVPLFETFPALDELSLPPSLFSLSSKAKSQVNFTLQNLSVTKLSLYMDQFDEDHFYSQTMRFFPRKLQFLVVFGNYLPLKSWKQLNTVKKFTILFGPNTALASCPQANLTNVKLLSHYVRSPPYIPLEYNPNFHRNHDISLGNMSWQFSLLDWNANGTSHKEMAALRKRMNVREDEEVVIEGIRIPATVIRDRMRRLREDRFAGSPLIHRPDELVANMTREINRILPNNAPPAAPPMPRRMEVRTFGQMRRAAVSRNRRNRSAPPAPALAIEMPPSSSSMRTQPPTPTLTPTPAAQTGTGAVLVNTIPSISPIVTASVVGATTTTSDVSRIGGTTVSANSELNRGFLGTPADSTISTTMNSEMTPITTVTASPERVHAPQGTGQGNGNGNGNENGSNNVNNTNSTN